MYVSLPGLTTASLAPQGRIFVRDFAATQPGPRVDQAAVYAAQAAEVLLAIEAGRGSDGPSCAARLAGSSRRRGNDEQIK